MNSSVEIVNWYVLILNKLISLCFPSLEPTVVLEKAELWSPVLAALSGLLFLVLIAKLSGFTKQNPEKMTDEELMPPSRFGLLAFIEMGWSVVHYTLESTLGDNKWERFSGVLGGTFFILLISALSGVLPGFEPAAADMSFSFAAGMFIFIYFIYYGIRETGWAFFKHLAGPIIWVAPFIFVIEFVSMLSRPVSLSLRIFGNLSGDHFVFALFSGLMNSMYIPFIPIPAIFLAFGSFMACVQAFIFMTLSAVYIKLALDSDAQH